MKKQTSILISVILGLALINGLAMAAYVTHTLTRSSTVEQAKMCEVDFKGETIPTNSYIDVSYSNLADWDSIDFKIAACSSGTITTANVIWKLYNGTVLNTETLTSGTDITDFDSGVFTVRIYNPVAGAAVKITGNILVTND